MLNHFIFLFKLVEIELIIAKLTPMASIMKQPPMFSKVNWELTTFILIRVKLNWKERVYINLFTLSIWVSDPFFTYGIHDSIALEYGYSPVESLTMKRVCVFISWSVWERDIINLLTFLYCHGQKPIFKPFSYHSDFAKSLRVFKLKLKWNKNLSRVN